MQMDAEPRRKILRHRDARSIVLGVLLPVFMGSLDSTILASALPAIGRELGEINNLPWLITAYLIASTAAIPLYGKISDIYGRRATLIAAILIYLIGSLACALAPNMLTLIVARVVHGIGGGGLPGLGMVILGDIAAPKDRVRYYGYFSIIFTTAGASGPALGGFLADFVGWRAIFWINIGLGLIALGIVSTVLRRLPRMERPHRLDFIGAALILLASVSAMLALSMGGVRFPWTSLPILLLGAVAVSVGAAFVWRLLTAPEPLIPLSILKDHVGRHAIIIHGIGWSAIVGLNIFLPIYLQTVMNYSATAAGLSLMLLMGTLNMSAWAMSTYIARATHYKRLPIAGMVLAIGSVLALAWQAGQVTIWGFELLLFLLGIGFGGIPPLSAVVLQNCVPPHQFGTALGTMIFSRGFFSTMTVAVFGAIVLADADSNGAVRQIVSVERFAIVFCIAAASLTVAAISLCLMEEKPLQSGDA